MPTLGLLAPAVLGRAALPALAPPTGFPGGGYDTVRIWGFQNADYDWKTFDLDRDMPIINSKTGFVDAVDPDLSRFKARGGQFATGLVIPAGKTATLSNAQFGDALLPTAPLAPNTATNCPGDPLGYGYQVNLGANVPVATGGMGCQAVAGAVIGPFPTAVLLRIWLTDFHAPVFTFYSDGNHATVVGSNPRLVSIRDSLFGTITTGPLLSPPGDGNLNVVVTIA